MNVQINDVLSAVAQRLGLKDTRIDTLRRKQDELAEAIRKNYNKLNDQKQKIALVDGKLSEKKREYDAAGPGLKAVIKRELILLLKQQDRIAEPVAAIADAIGRDELIKDKIDMLIFAETSPGDAEGIDDVVIDLQMWLKSNETVVEAAESLAGTSYVGKEVSEEDGRISAIGKTEVPISQTADEFDERISQLA